MKGTGRCVFRNKNLPEVVLTAQSLKSIICPALRVMADAITNLPHPGKVVRRKAYVTL